MAALDVGIRSPSASTAARIASASLRYAPVPSALSASARNSALVIDASDSHFDRAGDAE